MVTLIQSILVGWLHVAKKRRPINARHAHIANPTAYRTLRRRKSTRQACCVWWTEQECSALYGLCRSGGHDGRRVGFFVMTPSHSDAIFFQVFERITTEVFWGQAEAGPPVAGGPGSVHGQPKSCTAPPRPSATPSRTAAYRVWRLRAAILLLPSFIFS